MPLNHESHATYSNSYLYRADGAWLAEASTSLYFSVADRPDVVDDSATVDVLLAWAEIDPYHFWTDGGPLTVEHYEGVDDDKVDVYKITGETYQAPDNVPDWVQVDPEYNGESVSVPIVEIDGSISFYQLDDLAF